MTKLRAATEADLPRLALILGNWLRETGWMPILHTREEDLGFLRHLAATEVLRVAGDPPLGFLARAGGAISCLYLAPEGRRQGLGRALLGEAKAAEPRLRLYTFQANLAARAFYAAEGFVEIEWGSGAGNEEGLPDALLEWRRA